MGKIEDGTYGKDEIDGTEIWYEPYVRVLADKNAIPMEITDFEDKITRGQMAEILYNRRFAIFDFNDRELFFQLGDCGINRGRAHINLSV